MEHPAFIGPYRVEHLLGSGGMGAVYAAIAPDGARVAVKVLRDEVSTPDHRARLAREGLVRIDHPNVVRVIDSGLLEESTPYVALERLEGESLDRRIDRGPLEVREAIDVVAQACAGVAAAHASGIVHRDIKPSNLFLCEGGGVKVLDFGVARLASAKTLLTVSGTIVGTPAYLSPEQARARPDVDSRADVWALGAVLFHALTGVSPFDRGSPYATLLAVLLEPTPLLSRLRPEVPASLAALVERCLKKAPTDRPPDAFALGRELLAHARIESEVSAVEPAATALDEERIVSCIVACGLDDAMIVETAVRERGGEVVRVLEDALIGLFGRTAWHGDEAQRAVGAALHARHGVRRIGVGSGRVRSHDQGVAGTAVRNAEAACESDALGVAIDEETARAVSGRFLIEAFSGGFFEVAGELADDEARGPDHAAPIVGRESEIARLRQLADAALTGGGTAVVCITGSIGIGKTRLLGDIEAYAAGEPHRARVLSTGGDPLRTSTALSLVASALRRHAARSRARERGWPRLDEAAPPTERAHAVTHLAREAGGDRDLGTFLAELVGVRVPETPALRAARSDPQLMADRLRLAALDWLSGLGAGAPLVVLVDDVQWADEESLAVLAALAKDPRATRVLVLAAGRTGEPAARLGAEVLAIDGLARDASSELAVCVAERPLPQPVLDALVSRSEGNPLFLEQMTRVWVERGTPISLDALPLPLGVEGALQSRLDVLTKPERDACKRASVYGRPFRGADVAVLGVPEPAGTLLGLAHKHVLGYDETSQCFTFASVLLGEVAYRTIAEHLRGPLHFRVAEHLAAQKGGEAEEIATHYERGGDRARSASWYALAVLVAARRGDSPTVARYALRTEELGGAPEELRFDVHAAYADALRFLGRRDEQAKALDLALACAPDDPARARVLTERAALLCRLGRLDAALDVSDDAIARARSASDGDALALALGRRAEALRLMGKLDEAQLAFDEASAVSDPAPRTRGLLLSWRAHLMGVRGDVGAAREAFAASVREHTDVGDLRRAAAEGVNLADAYNRFGAYAEAETALRAALDSCRRVAHRAVEGYALLNLGWTLLSTGRAREALEVLASADDASRATGDVRLEVFGAFYRAQAWLRAGETADALRAAQAAVSLAQRLAQPDLESMARATLARALLSRGDAAQALIESAAALALRDRLGGLQENEADVFLAHADALRALGRESEAEQVLERARARVSEVASRIADAEWRERFLRDVPAHRALVGRS